VKLMGINNKIFNDAKVSKVLLKFAVPAIISLLVAELYNMVDTVFVGRYIGANAIGALTIAFPVQRFLISLGMLISVGASTYVARSLGEKNKDALKQTIMNSFVLTAVTLITVSLIVFIFKNSIIAALGASDNTFAFAVDYISIILIGGVFQCMAAVASYIMTALGNTKVTLYSNLLGTTSNIIINYILIAQLSLGVKGAAIATVISQMLVFGFVMYKFNEVKKSFNLEFTIKNMSESLNAGLITGIAAVGFSTFVIEISDAVVAVILNNLLFSQGGDEALIIVGVITRVSMFMFITIIGISSSMQPIVAYNYGAQNYGKMKEVLKIAIITVSVASIAFWAVFMTFAGPIIGFFLKDSEILREAITAFRISISLLPVVGIYYICIYYFQAVEESRRSFLLSIYRQIVIFIPVAILLVQIFGIVGAWIAYPVSDVISSITSLYFIKKAVTDVYDEESLENSLLIKQDSQI
jgi:putative MATE family efflux protein